MERASVPGNSPAGVGSGSKHPSLVGALTKEKSVDASVPSRNFTSGGFRFFCRLSSLLDFIGDTHEDPLVASWLGGCGTLTVAPPTCVLLGRPKGLVAACLGGPVGPVADDGDDVC